MRSYFKTHKSNKLTNSVKCSIIDMQLCEGIMQCEQWKEIFSIISADNDLSQDNVIEKIRERLGAIDPRIYKEWKETGFNVNHLFKISYGYNIYYCHTLLNLAVQNDRIDIVNTLIDRGADVNKASADRLSPLILAAEMGYVDIVNTLVDRGADVNKAGEYGWTPLLYAAENGRIEAVRALIDKGADINQAHQNAWIPLYLAIKKNEIDTYQYIIGYIAKLEVAGLNVSQGNLQLKNELVGSVQQRYNIDVYEESLQKCRKEIEKLEKADKPLYDFLKESNINVLISIWETNENICSKLDGEESLKKQYPRYANILINQANKVKKKFFCITISH